MARCLIIGCGCRGRMLAGALAGRGFAVRGTTREPARLGLIEQAGAEPVLGDPDRVATLVPALEHVTVACILLGSAGGSGEQLAALHGPRLQMLLSKLIDTTVHGVVYEARGTVEPALLGAGAESVRSFAARSHARVALLDTDPAVADAWLGAAVAAVERVLEGGPAR